MGSPPTLNLFPMLDADCLAYLLSYLTVPTLCRLRSTCKDADQLVAAELDFRYTTSLLPFDNDPTEFRNMLGSTGSVVSGSVAARIASGRRFSPNDLDVYTTSEAAPVVTTYLEARGYKSTGTLDPYLPEYRGGIKSVLRYAKGPRSIDVIVSLTQSATLPVVYFWATPVMVYMGGDGLCLLYPQLLEEHRSLVNPGRFFADSERLGDLVAKYECRGFKIKDEEATFAEEDQITLFCKGRHSATCPINTRFISDTFCLQTSFGTVDHRRRKRPFTGALASLTNVWWRGGGGCGGQCNSSGEIEFDAWTQAADMVGL